jgi:hypothetical protein
VHRSLASYKSDFQLERAVEPAFSNRCSIH